MNFANNNFHYKLLYTLENKEITSSINSFDWANWETTPKLAFCTSGGKIGILSKNFQSWDLLIKKINSNSSSLNSIKWEPLDIFTQNEKKLLTTAGCDKNIYFFSYLDGSKKKSDLNLIFKIEGAHQNWIRDISWSSNKFLGYNLLATSSEDNFVKIWKIFFNENILENNNENENIFQKNKEKDFSYEKNEICLNSPAWRLDWNPNGNLLAVGFTGNEGNCEKVYYENEQGKWICV